MQKLLIIFLFPAILFANVNNKLDISNFKFNQILHNKYMDICFDYKYKSATAVEYTITKDNLYKPKLSRDKIKFYADRRLQDKYRVSPYSYKKSGFDRGHLAPNGAFNYDLNAQKATFTMANMTPQYPKLNRYAWSKAERYSRVIATKLGIVSVLDIVYFDKNPKRLNSGQAIPSGYIKVITNKKSGFQKCFYYANISNPKLKLSDHTINCNNINFIS